MKFSLLSKNFISQRPHPQKSKCLVWLVLASGGYQLLRWNGRTRKRERDLLAGTYVSLIAVKTFIFLSVSCTLCMSRKYFGVFQDCSLLFSKLLSLSHTLTSCVCMCVYVCGCVCSSSDMVDGEGSPVPIAAILSPVLLAGGTCVDSYFSPDLVPVLDLSLTCHGMQTTLLYNSPPHSGI